MARFETRVTRHSDTETPRYRVDFIGEEGESVAVELAHAGDDSEDTRRQVLQAARDLAGRVARDEAQAAPTPHAAGPGDGLQESLFDTTERTRDSEGRSPGRGDFDPLSG